MPVWRVFSAIRSDFCKGEFAGEDNPGEPLLCRPEDAFGVMDGHLGGGMDREVRDDLPCQRGDPDILHQHRINTGCIQPDEIVRNPLEFAVMDERIDRDIDPDTPGMGQPDTFRDLVIRKICCILAGAEPFPAQVDRIGTRCNGCPE